MRHVGVCCRLCGKANRKGDIEDEERVTDFWSPPLATPNWLCSTQEQSFFLIQFFEISILYTEAQSCYRSNFASTYLKLQIHPMSSFLNQIYF